MKKLFTKYQSDLSGNFAILTAIMALPIAIGSAVAIELAGLEKAKTELRDAAESAAVASTKSKNRSDATRRETALITLDHNFNKITHRSSGVNANITLTSRRSTVEAQTTIPARLTGIIGKKNLRVGVRVAAESIFEPACVLIKSPRASNALRFQGHPLLNTVDCYVHNNSNSSQSSVAQGNPRLGTADVCLNGGFEGKKWTPGPELGCGVKSDPFNSVLKPPVPPCGPKFKKGRPGETVRLSPGNFCGGINIPSNANLALDPGVYIISDGPLKLGANATISGQDVMFYMTGDRANFELHSGGTWNVTPPQSGEYRGMVIFQDRDSTPIQPNEIKGGGSLDINGIIYTPNGELKLQGSPVLNIRGAGNMIVTDTMKLQGSPELNVILDNSPNLLPNDKVVGRDAYIRVIK